VPQKPEGRMKKEHGMKRSFWVICLVVLLCGNVWAEGENGIQVRELVKSGLSWDGGQLPDYSKGTPEITILRIKIPPGALLPMHKHPVINAGVLLAGELTVVTEENKILHLKAGDPIVEVVNKWHYGKNEGDKTAEILVFYAGVRDSPITVKK